MKFVPRKYNNKLGYIENKKYSWGKPIVFSIFVSGISFFVLPDATRKYVWLMLFAIPLLFRISSIIARSDSTDSANDFMGWW